MRDTVVCLLQASSRLERALIHDHPPLGPDPSASDADRVLAHWGRLRACLAIAAIISVVVALHAGIFGRFTSPIWAYLAFGSLYYLNEAAVMMFPTTAELFFLPVVLLLTGALGLVVSFFFQPQGCEIPFRSHLATSRSLRRPGTYAEWREWHLRLGSAERLNAKAPNAGQGWEPQHDPEAPAASESAQLGRGLGILFALLCGVGISLAEVGVVRGFTAARRGLGMYNGMVALNVAIFGAYFARMETLEAQEKQGTAIILVGFVFIGCGTAHPGSIPWAAWNGVCVGMSLICLRLAASASTRAAFYFLPAAALGAPWVFRHGLPEWDGTFMLLAAGAACATVVGVFATAAGFSTCRPFTAVAILGSFSTFFVAVHTVCEGRWPSTLLGLGMVVWAVGILHLCRFKPQPSTNGDGNRAVGA
jgi:hypothetical protein